jgi:hypothetical protein
MRVVVLVQVAVATALGALVGALVATPVALASHDVTRGVVVRAVLVLVVLAVVPWVVARRAAHHAARSPLLVSAALGLLAGYALTPTAWTGRAFVTQAFVEPGPLTSVLDLVGWLLIGVVSAVLATRSTRVARPTGYTA